MKLTNNELSVIMRKNNAEHYDENMEKEEEKSLYEESKKDLSQTKEFKHVVEQVMKEDPTLTINDIYIHYHWAVCEYCLYLKGKWKDYVHPEK